MPLCRSHSLALAAWQVYVWGRRHQYVNLSFLGIFNFTAPYLPWVLLAFSVVLGSSPVVDLLGMVAGAGYSALNPHARDLLAPLQPPSRETTWRSTLSGGCSVRMLCEGRLASSGSRPRGRAFE